MITSNEPGLYLEGRYGIRCENLIVTEHYETTEFGEFLHFHPMTLFPFDRNLFELEIMSEEEIKWVNDYHKLVRERLTPLLTPEEAEWLRTTTEPLV